MASGDEPREAEACCDAAADPRIRRWFDNKIAALPADAPLPALHDVSRTLLAELADVGEQRPSVLELGCGSGALSVTLLERGAEHVDGIDLSPASVAAAQRRAQEAGVGDRATFAVGNGASAPLTAHDWVVLDRVLCCYRDLDALVHASAGAARHRYAFSVPASSGWRGPANRLLFRLEILTAPLRGRPCPGFVHDVARIEGTLEANGFRRLRGHRAGMWEVRVFERVAAA